MLTATTPCLLCGFRHRVHRFSDIRVNKRSLRETGVSLISLGAVFCPECGTRNEGSSVPVSRYRLHPDDAAKVDACRERKWPGSTTAAAA